MSSPSPSNAPRAPVSGDGAVAPGIWPQAPWPHLVARLQNRLAMHLPVTRKRMTNRTPLVSFSFDDIPQNSAVEGARILEEHGAVGTFYVAGDLAGSDDRLWRHATAEQLLALHRAGHELGCHTFSHRKLHELDEATLAEENARNRDFFRRLDPSIELRSFAYPWGIGDYRRKRELARQFQTGRSVIPGINRGIVDPHFLLSEPLENLLSNPARIDRVLDEACAGNGWVIFYSHEVGTRTGEFVCAPELLRHALAAARQRNMRIASVSDAGALAGI